MVNKLVKLERRMREEHIAYIIRETCRGAIELNRNHIIHRDIRGDNILLTKDGRVKLCDFGLSREVDSTFGKRGTCIGSPCWMAPEIVTAMNASKIWLHFQTIILNIHIYITHYILFTLLSCTVILVDDFNMIACYGFLYSSM